MSALALAVEHLRAELEQGATGMDRADILSNLTPGVDAKQLETELWRVLR